MQYISTEEKEVLIESVKSLLVRLGIFLIWMLALQMFVRISYTNDQVLILKKEDIFVHSVLFGLMGVVCSYPMLKKPVEDALDFYGFGCGFDYIYDSNWDGEDAKEIRERRSDVKLAMIFVVLISVILLSVLGYYLASLVCSLVGV